MTSKSHFLLSPLLAALLFCASVVATSSLLQAFWFPAGSRTVVVLLPLPFLVLFACSEVRFFRRASEQQRSLAVEAVVFALALTIVALVGAELLALAGIAVWRNEDAWPYLALTGYLFGYWSAARRNQ